MPESRNVEEKTMSVITGVTLRRSPVRVKGNTHEERIYKWREETRSKELLQE